MRHAESPLEKSSVPDKLSVSTLQKSYLPVDLSVGTLQSRVYLINCLLVLIQHAWGIVIQYTLTANPPDAVYPIYLRFSHYSLQKKSGIFSKL